MLSSRTASGNEAAVCCAKDSRAQIISCCASLCYYSVLQVNSMTVIHDNPIPATPKDSCPETNLASTLLSGYHPDQSTKSITSGQFCVCVTISTHIHCRADLSQICKK